MPDTHTQEEVETVANRVGEGKQQELLGQCHSLVPTAGLGLDAQLLCPCLLHLRAPARAERLPGSFLHCQVVPDKMWQLAGEVWVMGLEAMLESWRLFRELAWESCRLVLPLENKN